MATRIYHNYSSCGACGNILNDEGCAFCASVEGANVIAKTLPDNRRFPVVGTIALIICAALGLVFFTQCPKQSPQSVNIQTSRNK